ncbi:MAG: PaaI family thioesterase [Raoultibacter sp.]
MLDENTPIETIREFFAGDHFATEACKATIVEARKGFAVCECTLERIHRNALGGVMGGAIFTLADFALAVASNIGEAPTVSICNSIEFLSGVQGEKLIATCEADKSGRSLGFYTVRITDDLGTLVASMTATCFRKS